MSYPANLRGWGPGWPVDRSADQRWVTARRSGVRFQVHHVIAPIVQFLIDEVERRDYLLHVEGDVPDDWGFNSRPIRGTTTPSSHSWGLAIDIDATKFPMGQSRNRPPQWIVDLFEAYGFEWGGRWRRPDPMHFEFAGSITEARHIVAMLAASHLAQEPPAMPSTVPQVEPQPEPDPPEEDDDMPKPVVIRHHGQHGHWLHEGRQRTKLDGLGSTQADRDNIQFWTFLCEGRFLDYHDDPATSARFLRHSVDISQVSQTALRSTWLQTVVGRIAEKLGVKT